MGAALTDLLVDANDTVTKGQVVARLHPAEQVARVQGARGAVVTAGAAVAAVIARLDPSVDPQGVAQTVRQWKHLSALTQGEQEDILIRSVVDKARKQNGLFLGILLSVSDVVIALIITTITMEKLRQIATLKQIGAPDRVIVGLIVQQLVALGVVGLTLGPSGSGKTTLLNIIGCIIDPSEGQGSLDSEMVYDNRWLHSNLCRLRLDKIGLIFQVHNLLPFLNATDNVALMLKLSGKTRAQELLDYLEVGHRARAMPAHHSGR